MTSLPELPDTERFEHVKTFRLVMKRADPFSPTIGDRGKLLAIRQIKGLTDLSSINDPLHASVPTYSSVKAVSMTFAGSMHKYNRFNDEEQGAWYCTFEHDTAVGLFAESKTGAGWRPAMTGAPRCSFLLVLSQQSLCFGSDFYESP